MALKENAGAFFPGIIVFRQPMNGKTFYRFRYTNVSEANRQALFFAMLQKQLGMRAVVARAAPRAHPDAQAGPGAWRAAAIVVFGKIM